VPPNFATETVIALLNAIALDPNHIEWNGNIDELLRLPDHDVVMVKYKAMYLLARMLPGALNGKTPVRCTWHLEKRWYDNGDIMKPDARATSNTGNNRLQVDLHLKF
jgi:hypothetical protein